MMPRRPPDAELLVRLDSLSHDGHPRRVYSGYRPQCAIRDDYQTSTHLEFIGTDGIATGQSAPAQVWFLTPEQYPHCLWIGRVLTLAEGSRVVGTATVLQVWNTDLLRPAPAS